MSADASTAASEASTDRRTRPHRSSSQEASKPYCQMLNGAMPLLPDTYVGPNPGEPLATVAALGLSSAPKRPSTPLGLARSLLNEGFMSADGDWSAATIRRSARLPS